MIPDAYLKLIWDILHFEMAIWGDSTETRMQVRSQLLGPQPPQANSNIDWLLLSPFANLTHYAVGLDQMTSRDNFEEVKDKGPNLKVISRHLHDVRQPEEEET